MENNTIGVVRERAPGERRVALVPEVVARLHSSGMRILVEAGAGTAAWFDDGAYSAAGASVVSGDDVYREAEVIVCVRPPEPATPLRAAQALALNAGVRR